MTRVRFIRARVQEKTWRLRPARRTMMMNRSMRGIVEAAATDAISEKPAGVNWRFRVPDGEEIGFHDQHLGAQRYVAGRDFGDFVVWRRDDVPAYQLAVAVDDHFMKISEVVRGADLLKSTARQLLIHRTLGWELPNFYHCDLVLDETGTRLAKRHDALSIRKLRESGRSARSILEIP